MEFVGTRTLADAIRAGPLSAQKAVQYVQAISEAVHFAHTKNVLHRDLKPSNILLNSFDEPRLTDFGLARSLVGESDLTLTGQALGSPAYMPPEQALGKHQTLGPTAMCIRSARFSIIS
jgi:serine/threonine protein kinase